MKFDKRYIQLNTVDDSTDKLNFQSDMFMSSITYYFIKDSNN